MKTPPPILSKDELRDAAGIVRAYFSTELDQELGQLAAEMLVEHFGQHVGKMFYNRGLRDAESVVRAKVEDISDTLYGLER
ncbi:DUF2164 domain-containing protein [Brevundimonas sp.]|uniref:DUF2164 domain-containing protein n=1 Tax=Brevundimonas sp. TaxID=1871086 RepID=UPI002FCC1BB9